MSKFQELKKLKETLADIEAAIESKATPDNIRAIMKNKLPDLKKQIAEADEAESEEFFDAAFEKKPKAKVVSKEKKKEPEIKDDKIRVKLLNGKEYSFSRSSIPHKETGIALMQMTDQSHDILISNDDMDKIVDFLKIKPVTDWLERANGDLFTVMGSENSYSLVPHKDNVTSLDGFEKEKKPEPKAEPKDDITECKKILEAANYDVKSKTVKTKNGKKTIKTREPRQDRSIIADRTESIFTTITKSFSSEEDKEANKSLLDLVENVKGLMVKFMNSLDKLVASKDVDKIKKIKELLKKLVE